MHEQDCGCDTIWPTPQGERKLFEDELLVLNQTHGIATAGDDLTGANLDPVRVAEAREEEREYVDGMNAYDRVPRSKIAEVNGKLVSTKWIEINKGDTDAPLYRSRLVVRGYNDGERRPPTRVHPSH